MIVGRRTCSRPNYVATCPSLDVLPTCLRAFPAWCRSVRCSCFRFAFLLSIISVCMSPQQCSRLRNVYIQSHRTHTRLPVSTCPTLQLSPHLLSSTMSISPTTISTTLAFYPSHLSTIAPPSPSRYRLISRHIISSHIVSSTFTPRFFLNRPNRSLIFFYQLLSLRGEGLTAHVHRCHPGE